MNQLVHEIHEIYKQVVYTTSYIKVSFLFLDNCVLLQLFFGFGCLDRLKGEYSQIFHRFGTATGVQDLCRGMDEAWIFFPHFHIVSDYRSC